MVLELVLVCLAVCVKWFDWFVVFDDLAAALIWCWVLIVGFGFPVVFDLIDLGRFGVLVRFCWNFVFSVF